MLWSAPKRLKGLEEDLAETRSEVKALRLEWDETYEKLLKLYRKTAAERAKLEKQDSPEGPEPDMEPQQGNGEGPSLLSPKQKLIQQQILRRRAGMR